MNGAPAAAPAPPCCGAPGRGDPHVPHTTVIGSLAMVQAGHAHLIFMSSAAPPPAPAAADVSVRARRAAWRAWSISFCPTPAADVSGSGASPSFSSVVPRFGVVLKSTTSIPCRPPLRGVAGGGVGEGDGEFEFPCSCEQPPPSSSSLSLFAAGFAMSSILGGRGVMQIEQLSPREFSSTYVQDGQARAAHLSSTIGAAEV